MKKRILSLFWATFILMIMIPANALIFASGEETGSGAETSAIGKVVQVQNEGDYDIRGDYFYTSVTESSISSGNAFRVEDSNISGIPFCFVVVDEVEYGGYTKYYKLATVDGSTNEQLQKTPWLKAILCTVIGDAPQTLVGATANFKTATTIFYENVTESGASGSFGIASLPEKVVIIAEQTVNGEKYYQVALSDGSSDENFDKLPWVKASDVNIIDMPSEEGVIEGQVTVVQNGNTANEIMLAPGEKQYVFTEFGAAVSDVAQYQWQMKVVGNGWADVKDYVYPYAIISDALIQNALDADGKAYLRCMVTDGDKRFVTPEMAVTLMSNAVSVNGYVSSAKSVTARSISDMQNRAGDDLSGAFHISIQYRFLHETAEDEELDGSNAANTFTITLGAGMSFDDEIISPPVLGYKPYVDWKEGDTAVPITYAGHKLIPADEVKFNNQSSKIDVIVYYVPQNVTFRVKHFKQNLQDDEYTEWKTEFRQGLSDTAVNNNLEAGETTLALTEVGFSALYYDKDTIITNDGNTVVEIYYDRIYYLVKYELGDGGYGVMPNYVRYGTSVMLGTPTRPGYAFTGWKLTSVKDTTEGAELLTDANLTTTYQGYNVTAANSQVTVGHNLVYTAQWTKATTSYTVIYWLENADDDKFSMVGSKTVNAEPGDVVSATDDLVRDDKAYFQFNNTLSDNNVIVNADGTTAVNAYYLRRYYTLTFSMSGRDCLIDEHVHDASCPDGTCDLEVHTHTDACGVASMTCTKEEHTHTDDCYLCVEHTHTNDCYDHELSCYSTSTNKLKAPGNNNNYTGNINDPQTGYVYRYAVGNWMSTSYYNYFYFEGQWYALGNSREINNIRNDYGITIPNRLSNPNRDQYTSVEATLTSSCNCTPKDTAHTHGDGNCFWKDDEHIHGQGSCTCNIVEHDHTSGCVYCSKEQHAHSSACYTYSCGKTAHTHGGDCVRDCQIPEHTHGSCGNNFQIVKRKYGASISDVWQEVWDAPDHTDGIRWDPSGSSIYSQVLVYFPFMPPENITLSADSGGSKNFTMHYMLESLTSNGDLDEPNNFTELVSVDAKYGYLTKAEDFFDIVGFTQYKSTPTFTNNQISTAGDVYLYYERNNASLVFMSNGSTLTSLTKTLMYEQPIGSECEPASVPYPTNMEANAVEFVGWYTTKNCADGTEFFFDESTTMPLDGLYLYAKWTPTVWSVSVYLDKEKTISLYENSAVEFGSMIAEPKYSDAQMAHSTYKDLIFAGWYYEDNGSEERFDFNTMAIKQGYVIYAKWTSHIPVEYVVRYVIENGDGTYTDIADQTKGVSLAGVSKSFIAKHNSELYAEYQREGDDMYLPEVRSQSKEMSTVFAENVIIFKYHTAQSLKYTIKHTFHSDKFGTYTGSDTYEISWEHSAHENTAYATGKLTIKFDTELETRVKAQANGNAIWEIIMDLSPDYYQRELILTKDSDQNVVEFNWEDRGVVFVYQVVHYFPNLNSAGTELDGTYTTTYIDFLAAYDSAGKATITATPIEVIGFEHDASHTDSLMTTQVSKTGMTEKLLKVYYKRQMMSYKVQYVYGTTTETVAREAVPYEKVVAETAKEIAGYAVSGASTQNVSITYDGQIIVFNYVVQQVIYNYQVAGNVGGFVDKPQERINVTAIAVGSLPTAWTGYIFVGWYTDAECQIAVDDSWWQPNAGYRLVPQAKLEDANKTFNFYAKFVPTKLVIDNDDSMTLENDNQAFVYKVTYIYTEGGEQKTGTIEAVVVGKGKITIVGIPVGATVTVTPVGDWAWRYTPSGTYTGEISGNTSGITIAVTYTVSNDQWLSDTVNEANSYT